MKEELKQRLPSPTGVALAIMEACRPVVVVVSEAVSRPGLQSVRQLALSFSAAPCDQCRC
jgi:hypothetical protein